MTDADCDSRDDHCIGVTAVFVQKSSRMSALILPVMLCCYSWNPSKLTSGSKGSLLIIDQENLFFLS